MKEKERLEKLKSVELKKKGNAMHDKKKAEAERKEEEELARKAMELEAEHEKNMTEDEKRQLERKRLEAAGEFTYMSLVPFGEASTVVYLTGWVMIAEINPESFLSFAPGQLERK